MIFSLGYNTEKGLKILKETGEIIGIPAVKIGNMKSPSPEKMAEFINSLTSEDILLSPSGPNASYLAGAFRQGSQTYWINSATFKDEAKKETVKDESPQSLLELWQKNSDIFYPYQEDDVKIAKLRVAYKNWIDTEKEKVALENSLSQAMLRLQESFRFLEVDPEKWIEEETKRSLSRVRSALEDGGLKWSDLETEFREKYETTILRDAERGYGIYFAGDTEAIEKQMALTKQKRLASILDLLKEQEKSVEKLLKPLPHNAFFNDFKGAATKVRAGVLTYMRNPLLYPSFPHLVGYFGLDVVDGEGIRRQAPKHEGDLDFQHQGRRVFCFDFGDKANRQEWWKDLYHIYKCHQYLVFWPLIELTEEIPYAESKQARPSPTEIKEWTRRILEIAPSLPRYEKDKTLREFINELGQESTWPRLQRLFSPKRGCFNFAMPRIRVEKQVKRLLGRTLAQIIYYRWWPEVTTKPLPLEQDFIYCKQYKKLIGSNDVPLEFDRQVVLDYYAKTVRELQQAGKALPEKEWFYKDDEGRQKERFPELKLSR